MGQSLRKSMSVGLSPTPVSRFKAVSPAVMEPVRLQRELPDQSDRLQGPIVLGEDQALPPVHQPSPEELYSVWQQSPTRANGTKLLHSLQPSIDAAVRKWTGSNNPIAAGHARAMVIDALPRYLSEKSSLGTFVDRQLQPLQRWVSRKNVGIRVPTGLVADFRRVQAAKVELEDELGRMPSFDEICDRTGIPIQRLTKINKMRYPQIAEATVSVGETGDDAYMDDQAVEDDAELWKKTIYHSLTPTDQLIFQHSIGLYGAEVLPNQEIAKLLRITPGAVSQRKVKIQRMLETEAGF